MSKRKRLGETQKYELSWGGGEDDNWGARIERGGEELRGRTIWDGKGTYY